MVLSVNAEERLGERIAALEVRVAMQEQHFNAALEAIKDDRKEMKDAISTLTKVFAEWRNKQTGFIAGAGLIISVIASAASVVWKDIWNFFASR